MFIYIKKNKYEKENELLNEKNKKLLEEIEKLKKENDTYMIQLKDEREKLEISKKENNDLINKNSLLENERDNYKNSNINLNNQLNQKASEVRLYLYNNKINIVNN